MNNKINITNELEKIANEYKEPIEDVTKIYEHYAMKYYLDYKVNLKLSTEQCNHMAIRSTKERYKLNLK